MPVAMRQNDDTIVMKYKNIMYRMTKFIYPDITTFEMEQAMNWSISKREKEIPVVVDNSYSHKTSDQTIRSITNYILDKQPICTSWGVMFKKHGTVPNPLADMIKEFMDLRGIHKKQMFQFPKGTEEFAKFFILQLLDKTDCNSIYGSLGKWSCIFYNLNVAASITGQGRSLISSVIMFFEMILSNNVKFGSLDEIITFIDNVISEKNKRHFNDKEILDRDIDREECFTKIIGTIGDFRRGKLKWVPDMKDLEIIWDIVSKLDQEDVNRLYYKNNLIAFCDNAAITNAIVYILSNLNSPYMDPNDPPEEIKVELDVFTDLIREYVFYNYQIIDRIDRNEFMIKNIAALSDTDSAIVSMDGWYRYVLQKVAGMKFKLTQMEADPVSYMEGEPCVEHVENVLDYDFYNDEIIEIKRAIKPNRIIAEDCLRYSIINIMSYVCGILVNEYMIEYTKQTNSYRGDKECLIISKNEFLFYRVLLTNNKKNYASKQEIQEGKRIPDGIDTALDIKGLPINKSTLNEKSRKELQRILYEDVLNTREINQLQLIKDLAIFERTIYDSLKSGEKFYYKPASIKSMNSYDDPMRIQGVKASVIWNEIRDPEVEALDLDARNTIDIVKVNIDESNVNRIKEKYPDTYERVLGVLRNPSIQKFTDGGASKKGSITAIAIPTNVEVPAWILEFIDYTTIINDSMSNFPIESCGIGKMGKNSINYTNIISI